MKTFFLYCAVAGFGIYGCNQSQWYRNSVIETQKSGDAVAAEKAEFLEGCTIRDIGRIGNVDHVVVAKCVSRDVTATSEQDSYQSGKTIITDHSATVRIEN